MKLLFLCLLFGVVLSLTRAENQPNIDGEDPNEGDVEPDSVDETELSEADDIESVENSHGCNCRVGRWCIRGGRRYMFVSQALHWSAAQQNCLARGATLASIPNASVNNYLKNELAKGRVAWVGLFDAANEGYWFWINDGKRVSYNNWCKGEPNNLGHEHCLQINWTREKCWNDARCTNRYPFICERK